MHPIRVGKWGKNATESRLALACYTSTAIVTIYQVFMSHNAHLHLPLSLHLSLLLLLLLPLLLLCSGAFAQRSAKHIHSVHRGRWPGPLPVWPGPGARLSPSVPLSLPGPGAFLAPLAVSGPGPGAAAALLAVLAAAFRVLWPGRAAASGAPHFCAKQINRRLTAAPKTNNMKPFLFKQRVFQLSAKKTSAVLTNKTAQRCYFSSSVS